MDLYHLLVFAVAVSGVLCNPISPGAQQFLGMALSVGQQRAVRMGLRDNVRRWPSASVPYRIRDGDFDDLQSLLISVSIPLFNLESMCVTYRPADETDTDYVLITNEKSGCWSHVGRIGGVQQLNLQSDDEKECLDKDTVLHVLSVAAGSYSLQTAPEDTAAEKAEIPEEASGNDDDSETAPDPSFQAKLLLIWAINDEPTADSSQNRITFNAADSVDDFGDDDSEDGSFEDSDEDGLDFASHDNSIFKVPNYDPGSFNNDEESDGFSNNGLNDINSDYNAYGTSDDNDWRKTPVLVDYWDSDLTSDDDTPDDDDLLVYDDLGLNFGNDLLNEDNDDNNGYQSDDYYGNNDYFEDSAKDYNENNNYFPNDGLEYKDNSDPFFNPKRNLPSDGYSNNYYEDSMNDIDDNDIASYNLKDDTFNDDLFNSNGYKQDNYHPYAYRTKRSISSADYSKTDAASVSSDDEDGTNQQADFLLRRKLLDQLRLNELYGCL